MLDSPFRRRTARWGIPTVVASMAASLTFFATASGLLTIAVLSKFALWRLVVGRRLIGFGRPAMQERPVESPLAGRPGVRATVR